MHVTRLPPDAVVTDAACGNAHTMAVTADGRLFGFGYNEWGSVGIGIDEDAVYEPELVMNPSGEDTMNRIKATIVAVACGNAHTVALASDGRVFGFGFNSYGQLGNGTTTLAPEPVEMQAPPPSHRGKVVAVACGHDHTVLLLQDGSVWSCGRNQASDDSTTQPIHPPTGPLVGWLVGSDPI